MTFNPYNFLKTYDLCRGHAMSGEFVLQCHWRCLFIENHIDIYKKLLHLRKKSHKSCAVRRV